jgi:hypothetical protein
MRVALVVLGVFLVVLGLVGVLLPDKLSAWRQRRYGQALPTPDFFELRGGISIAIGIASIVLGLALGRI